MSGRRRVWAVMKNGERWEGDILVGADGIHSKVGKNLELDYSLLCLPCTAWLLLALKIISHSVALLSVACSQSVAEIKCGSYF